MKLNGIDILKYLMSLIIVCVHGCLFETLSDNYWSTLMRNMVGLCVPIFFVISSFFFNKVRTIQSNLDRYKMLIVFEKRIFILYLFWTIVQLPYILYIHHYSGFIGTIFGLLKDFFFEGTFIASWFLGAMMLGIPIVFLLMNSPKYAKFLLGICIMVGYIYS